MDARDEGPFEFAHGFEDPRDTKPSLEQIALTIVQRIWAVTELDQPGLIIETSAVAEQLRQVWNARGSADCDEVVGVGDSISSWSAVEITDAIRKLDR